MKDITIRRATATDKFQEIATCLYLTDPFIYPGAFGTNKDNAFSAISELMKIEHGLFNYQNIYLAFYHDQLCGTLLHSNAKARWEQDICISTVAPFVPNLSDFIKVSEAYFSKAAQHHDENIVEIIACSVLPKYHNMGIGSALLTHFIMAHPDKVITLDVLSENSAAIALYKKCGFVIKEAYKGFHLDEDKRPNCYNMVRPTSKIGIDSSTINY